MSQLRQQPKHEYHYGYSNLTCRIRFPPLSLRYFNESAFAFFTGHFRISESHILSILNSLFSLPAISVSLNPRLMRTGLLSSSPLPRPKLCFDYSTSSNVDRRIGFKPPYLPQRSHKVLLLNRRRCFYQPNSIPNFTLSSSLETRASTEIAAAQQESRSETSILLDVSGMMCGGCVSRVKSVLSSDERVDSVAVNMLTETAAIRLKPEVLKETEFAAANVADNLAQRLTECGFSAKRRASGMGVADNVRKWKEMLKKKEELLLNSRNRVAFAWTLVALCCGSHASHILHSLGIHVAHGNSVRILFCILSF